VVLATLLVPSASAQVVEGYIQLPDSFGVFRPPYQVAVDYTPGAERLFVIGESSEVLVVDAINFRKLARIPVQARSLCFSSAHDKLYVAELTSTTLDVVDGSSYQVIKQVPLGDNANWLFYNPIVDRVYCGTYHWRVIDCSSDSVVDTVDMDGWGACRAFDSLHNKLYVSTGSALKVIDCYSDSATAAIQRVSNATAICYNSANDRVYATTNTGGSYAAETLYVVDTEADSVVAQLQMPNRQPFSPTFTICSDPVHNRVFTACSSHVAGVDCGGDAPTVMWVSRPPLYPPSGLTCAPELDKAYMAWTAYVVPLDGSTGDIVSLVQMDGTTADPLYLQRLRSLYCASYDGRFATIDCNMDTVQGVLPLTPLAERVCMDTVDDKLYFAHTEYSSYLGVVDCSAGRVQSVQMCKGPREMVHNWRDNKLYVVTWNGFGGNRSGVSVYDCRSDSLVKVIPVGYVRGELQWHPGLNKVYAGANDSLSQDYVVVIDCATDSVARVLPRGSADDGFRCTLLSPELDQFWGISPHGYTVVDCLKDSIVMDTVTGYRLAMGVSYSAADRKVYVVYSALTVLSMESLRPIGSVPLPPQESEEGVLVYLPSARKLYGAMLTSGWEPTDSIYVLDTRTDSIVSRFDARHIIRAMREDATGRYVYCTAMPETLPGPDSLLVIDSQCDSIVSRIHLPDMGGTFAGEWLVPNRRTGRIYAGPGSNGRLVVIRDSVVIGLEERKHTKTGLAVQQTVVSRSVPLRLNTQADLYDASGRRAAVLRPGPNDISHLAPGVYFVREEPQAASFKPQAVCKVVIAR
jgi:DNA-binding beta-propeller fold protein YncE